MAKKSKVSLALALLLSAIGGAKSSCGKSSYRGE